MAHKEKIAHQLVNMRKRQNIGTQVEGKKMAIVTIGLSGGQSHLGCVQDI